MCIDRLSFAGKLAAQKRVVDIGGSRMFPDGQSPFDKAYKEIALKARSYTIIDKGQNSDIQADLSDINAVTALQLPACDVILCMETLEHLRNPGLLCDKIAEAVRDGATAYITLPRQSACYRYLEARGLGKFWGKCHHLYGFHRHHLAAFLEENFPGLDIQVHACIGKYSKLWPIVWLATGGRGLSWGDSCKKTKKLTVKISDALSLRQKLDDLCFICQAFCYKDIFKTTGRIISWTRI